MKSSRKLAVVHGSPGERPRLVGLAVVLWPSWLAMALAGYLVRAAWPRPDMGAELAGAGLVLVALGFAAAILPRRRRLDAYFKGARGEERVARELGLLPGEYTVLNGLVLPGDSGAPADLDHVVVGPSGVWVVETKNWRAPVTLRDEQLYCGERQPDRDPLEQARSAALRLENHLNRAVLGAPRAVRPVVCFAGDTFAGGRARVGAVSLCNTDRLNGLLTEAPESPLDPAQCRAAVAVLLRPGA